MVPIRILLVEDPQPALPDLRSALERSGDFEVACSTSFGAGMLSLARRRPDLLVLDPYAGRGSVDGWRRAVRRYRSSHALGLLALSRRFAVRDRELLREMADLGVFSPPVTERDVRTLLEDWANSERLMAGMTVPMRR